MHIVESRDKFIAGRVADGITFNRERYYERRNFSLVPGLGAYSGIDSATIEISIAGGANGMHRANFRNARRCQTAGR